MGEKEDKTTVRPLIHARGKISTSIPFGFNPVGSIPLVQSRLGFNSVGSIPYVFGSIPYGFNSVGSNPHGIEPKYMTPDTGTRRETNHGAPSNCINIIEQHLVEL